MFWPKTDFLSFLPNIFNNEKLIKKTKKQKQTKKTKKQTNKKQNKNKKVFPWYMFLDHVDSFGKFLKFLPKRIFLKFLFSNGAKNSVLFVLFCFVLFFPLSQKYNSL